MVQRDEVIAQLKAIGVSVKSWGAAEINELPHILVDGEKITHLLHGWYENGFATLVATDCRLLLVDKKLIHLTVEDVRYDMIAEVDFNAQLADATVCISTVNKKLSFTSFKKRLLRELTTYVQSRVMELRRQYDASQPEPASAQPQPQAAPQLGAFFEANQVPTLPIASPDTAKMRVLSPVNPYARRSFTMRHNSIFLPKIPRRLRPSPNA